MSSTIYFIFWLKKIKYKIKTALSQHKARPKTIFVGQPFRKPPQANMSLVFFVLGREIVGSCWLARILVSDLIDFLRVSHKKSTRATNPLAGCSTPPCCGTLLIFLQPTTPLQTGLRCFLVPAFCLSNARNQSFQTSIQKPTPLKMAVLNYFNFF